MSSCDRFEAKYGGYYLASKLEPVTSTEWLHQAMRYLIPLLSSLFMLYLLLIPTGLIRLALSDCNDFWQLISQKLIEVRI